MNHLCEKLKIRYPIIQAPMNYLTGSKLVAAVSQAGGLGVLGPNSGKINQPRKTTEERYTDEIRSVQKIAKDPFAVNIISPDDNNTPDFEYAKKVIDVSLKNNVKLFAVVGDVNRYLFDLILNNGGQIIFRALNPTTENAKEAVAAGADFIVATGYDEGGFLPQGRIGTFSIVPQIVDAVDVPVIAAGGINDIRGVRAAFALGAQAVYVGTRFIASYECDAAASVKEHIVGAPMEDVVFVSSYQRSIKNNYSIEMSERYGKGLPSLDNADIVGKIRKGMAEGDLQNGICSVNSAVGLIKEIKSAAQIIRELMSDFI